MAKIWTKELPKREPREEPDKRRKPRSRSVGAVDSEQLNDERTRVGAIEYRCVHCNGEMRINKTRSYPTFLARKFRCLRCGRMSDTVLEEREIKKI